MRVPKPEKGKPPGLPDRGKPTKPAPQAPETPEKPPPTPHDDDAPPWVSHGVIHLGKEPRH